MHIAPGVCNIHNAIDKSVHKRKRRVIGQGLSDQCMRSFEPTILSHVDIFVRKLMTSSNGDELNNNWSKPVNMTHCAKHLGFDIMGNFGFGQSFEMQSKVDNHFLIDAVTATNYRSGVYFQFPSMAKYKLEKLLSPNVAAMRKKYGQLMNDLVRTRAMTDKHSRRDLLSFIDDAQDSGTGEGFTETELWSESRFLLVAGRLIRR